MADFVDPGLAIAREWNLDSALAYYHENGRIQAVEPVVSLSRTFTDESILSFDGVFDTLSGSTPNGALTSNRAQTFTSPSGKSFTGRHTYVTPAGRLPADASYSDQRVAFSGSWEFPVTRTLHATTGTKFSYEDDFDSVTASAGVAKDFNDKNTTLNVSTFDEFDWISPIGGTPVAGSDYTAFDKSGGNVTKNGTGAVLGVTQIVSRRWISDLNISVDRFHGYLNDPYKIISVLGADGSTSSYEYEKRPDQRVRKSVYLENRVAGDRWSSALSLRYMADDWHVRSATAELNAHLWFNNHERYLEPSVRWYHQSAASFYTPYLTYTTGGLPTYASSDTRLSRFHALTFGIKYAQEFFGRPDRAASELSVRMEYYRQTIENRFSTPSNLQGLSLYPDLDALFVQVGWRF